MDKTRRLFILGAGSSYAAGLPDGDRLASQLFGYVGGAPWEVVYNKPPVAYWNPLYGTLGNVMRDLATGGMQSRWALDQVFDRFHEMMRRNPVAMGPTYGQLFEAAAQLLYTRSCSAARTEAYRRFVEALEPGDVVLTFNWDVCAEMALHDADRPFSRALSGDPPANVPWLLKLHGSIDYLIVDVDAQLKGGGRPEFLEALNAEAPSPLAGRRFELTRLRTFDLGYEVSLDQVSARDRETAAMPGVIGGFDVGPYLLTHVLEEYPTFHMLTPGAPDVLYRWQYDLVSDRLAAVSSEIGEITVVGYSFPAYDEPVHEVLRTVFELAGEPPTHIVNPAVATLAPELLQSIFGSCELHPVGFGDYDWRRSAR